MNIWQGGRGKQVKGLSFLVHSCDIYMYIYLVKATVHDDFILKLLFKESINHKPIHELPPCSYK